MIYWELMSARFFINLEFMPRERYSGMTISKITTGLLINLNSNKKESLYILHVKKDLKFLDPTELDSPEGTRMFKNESLCAYYRRLWNKCKKLKWYG